MKKEDFLELKEIMQNVDGHSELRHKINLICKSIALGEEQEEIQKELQDMDKK